MKNFWLNKSKFKIGKRVKYIGLDGILNGKEGVIIKVYTEWIDVMWEFPRTYSNLQVTVEKKDVQVISNDFAGTN